MTQTCVQRTGYGTLSAPPMTLAETQRVIHYGHVTENGNGPERMTSRRRTDQALESPTAASGGGSLEKLSVSFREVAAFPNLEALWMDLERRSNCSFFQSWGWIGGWLPLLPQELRPKVLIVEAVDRVVGLSILIACSTIRHFIVPSNAWYLQETGRNAYDSLTMEYNGFLSEKGMGAVVAKCALTWLANNEASWDELYLGGLDPTNRGTCEEAANGADLKLRVQNEKSCAHVDLDWVRSTGGDYLSAVSRNTRYQLRRSLRLYEEHGPVTIRVASSCAEGLDLFNELKVHHQTTWILRGKPGSFANPFFEQFHRRLIEERFDTGGIQLAHITSAKKTIGVLYNFLWRGVVYAYQSGFNYEDDPKRKPGLVSHYMAIRYNLSTSARIYDFMAGRAQHKTSLSTDAISMVWIVLQRDRFKYQLEDFLRSLKRKITRML